VIVGEQLSAVSFSLDYLQLTFNGPCFTVHCPIQVATPSGTAKIGQSGFRDRICEVIGHTVKSLAIDDRAVTIEFDACWIRLDLSTSEPLGEKLRFQDEDGALTIWHSDEQPI
jgi:hypothetical protein